MTKRTSSGRTITALPPHARHDVALNHNGRRMGSASSGGFYRQPGAMASKRTLLSVTMTAEEWHHVLGVLRAGAKHLEPAADAVADTFSDAYSRALLVLSAAETMEILEDLVASDNDPRR